MNFLNRLFDSERKLVSSWEVVHFPSPRVDLSRMCFGVLRFGAELAAASVLGRPDQFNRLDPHYFELVYGSSGFLVDFEKGKLACLSFLIGPDRFVPEKLDVKFCRPRISGLAGGELQLSPATTRKELEASFGKPESTDVDEDETILFYTLHGIRLEFELEPKEGKLKRWNLFPKASS
jgi:hypothetical protein